MLSTGSSCLADREQPYLCDKVMGIEQGRRCPGAAGDQHDGVRRTCSARHRTFAVPIIRSWGAFDEREMPRDEVARQFNVFGRGIVRLAAGRVIGGSGSVSKFTEVPA
jgi:hypothetical protein